jgi:hypothetical protein
MANRGPRNLSRPLQRYGQLVEIAHAMIDGPRSVIPETGEDVEAEWYDPIIKLTDRLGATRSVEGITLLRLSNCEEVTDRNAMLIRHVVWNAQGDRQRCQLGDVAMPGVQVRFAFVPQGGAAWVHLLLVALDRSLTTIPFSEEGFVKSCSDNQGAVSEGTPSGPVEISDANHYGLERIARFQGLEFQWTPIAGEDHFLNRSFRELFDYLKECLANHETQAKLVEIYDVDPGTMTEGKVIALAINALHEKRFRKLRDIVVSPERKLYAFKEGGWMVTFVFETEDEFMNRTLRVEVSHSGRAEVFLSL